MTDQRQKPVNQYVDLSRGWGPLLKTLVDELEKEIEDTEAWIAAGGLEEYTDKRDN